MVIRLKTIFLSVGLIIAAALAAVVTSGISQQAFYTQKNFRVICDAGHGAPDSGAVGAAGTLEKDINLAITEKLGEILEQKGMSVTMTRSGDKGIYGDESKTIRQMKIADMKKRLSIMKESGADLFISIHMNSFADSGANGVNVFYTPKYEAEIKPLAEDIQESVCSVTGAEGHKVRPAESWVYLMKNSPVPAVLIECGFISNPDEEKKLNDEEYQAKIAWAIANAVDNYAKKNE